MNIKNYSKTGIVLILCLILFPSMIPVSESGPKIVFKEVVYDFGNIKRHADGSCSFEFTNQGDVPLLVTKVTASCGCTVPSYSKAPVLPGETGHINIKYNTKTVGVFSKTINVSTTDPNNPTVVLTIKGTVIK